MWRLDFILVIASNDNNSTGIGHHKPKTCITVRGKEGLKTSRNLAKVPLSVDATWHIKTSSSNSVWRFEAINSCCGGCDSPGWAWNFAPVRQKIRHWCGSLCGWWFVKDLEASSSVHAIYKFLNKSFSTLLTYLHATFWNTLVCVFFFSFFFCFQNISYFLLCNLDWKFLWMMCTP